MAWALASLTVSTAAGQTAKVPTAAEWRADLHFLDATIRSVHPAPFHRTAEADYARAVAALDQAIPSLGPRQIAVRLAAIVTLLHDGHSRLGFEDPFFPRGQAYPVRIDRFPDGIRVVASLPTSIGLLGARLIRFGNASAEAAWDSLASIASGENVFSRWSAVPSLATMPALVDVLGLAPESGLTLVGVTDRGDTVRATIAPAVASPDRAWFSTGWTGPAGATATIARPGVEAPLSERHRADTYWYTVEGSRLYAQVNAVGNAGAPVHLGDQVDTASFAGFTQQVLARLDAGGINRMALDLRYNDGGNNGLVKGMVAGLAARPTINQRGRLFVVTGRTTYSAAMNFTSLLEDRTAAIFVGEPPGGAPRHYGDATRFTLPNSRLNVNISTLRWEIGVEPTDIRHVMEPGLPAPPTAAALAAGRDPALEAIDRYPTRRTLSERLLEAYKAGGLAAVRTAYSSEPRAGAEPWNSVAQQLVAFAYSIFPVAKGRQDIFDVFGWVTEAAPASVEAWYARGRISAFAGDWTGARAAYDRARAGRPNDDFLRRMAAVAERR
jgi:hypothetical protein